MNLELHLHCRMRGGNQLHLGFTTQLGLCYSFLFEISFARTCLSIYLPTYPFKKLRNSRTTLPKVSTLNTINEFNKMDFVIFYSLNILF